MIACEISVTFSVVDDNRETRVTELRYFFSILEQLSVVFLKDNTQHLYNKRTKVTLAWVVFTSSLSSNVLSISM